MHSFYGPFDWEQLIQSLLGLGALVGFWVWMFRDMLQNDDLTRDQKRACLRLFLVLNVLGAAIYYAGIYNCQRRHRNGSWPI